MEFDGCVFLCLFFLFCNFFQGPSIEGKYFVGGALCQDPPALPAPEAEQSKEKEKPFCNFLQLSNFD